MDNLLIDPSEPCGGGCAFIYTTSHHFGEDDKCKVSFKVQLIGSQLFLYFSAEEGRECRQANIQIFPFMANGGEKLLTLPPRFQSDTGDLS